ncbi:MAG: hypothetical protein IPJ33_12730 [Gammaproteobacteria bacterium]|jgi:hypothetical protein|nr:hypothetical protein [Gammaproteobacteria bacterium]MBP6052115.1 hypothetical protein [Pseudomonadales bacterium]MBK6582176.1 hypothetical protein [Gammaproteobacteria bacterium]MBK7170571.1 hypothetical protein [Gammaproteobacteria bacterium]MBK7521550.1 hypothetical protein [Gammaproteobacteria bacterium]
MSNDNGAAELRAAWDDLIARLQEARNAIDDPALYPPPPSERVLAEGYRYVLGFLYGSIQRVLGPSVEHPLFQRAIQPLNRSTIDNADAVYLCAPIDGNYSYRIRARAADTRHWRGEARVPGLQAAPQYVIFEAPSGYAGDSGSIREMAPGSRTNCGTLDSSAIQVQPDGSFEILLAPERPAGYTGNFIATRATRSRTQKDGSTVTRDYVSRFVVLREIFYDWENERLLDLDISRLDRHGEHPAALDTSNAVRQIREIGYLTRNQVHFWNEFYAVAMEVYGDMNGDGKCFIPRNGFNAPNAAGLATGGGMSTNIYCGGIYELADDEAMIVELRQPVEPDYIGFHLANMWGESPDFANHQCSLNAFQADRDADGVFRYVIAHRDPGIANWVDTTLLPEGYMSVRWAYGNKPTEPELMPSATATKIRFDQIGAHLPAARRVSEQERRAVIRTRQRHVQYRYRQH